MRDGLISSKGQPVEKELLCGKWKQRVSRYLGQETRKNNYTFSLKMGYPSYLPGSLFGSLLSGELTLLPPSTEKVTPL